MHIVCSCLRPETVSRRDDAWLCWRAEPRSAAVLAPATQRVGMKKKSYKYKLYPKKILRHFSPAQVSFFCTLLDYLCKTMFVCLRPNYSLLCVVTHFIYCVCRLNFFLSSKKKICFLHTCATCFELPSNIITVCPRSLDPFHI